MKLSIGAGVIRRGGWVHLDAVGGDITAIIPPLPAAVTNRKWDEVEMIHVLEHFYPWDAAALLRDIRGILEPGGKLVIEVPNLRFACEVLAGVRSALDGMAPGQSDMWVLYGNPELLEPLQMHRWAYTPETLSAALRSAGFSRVDVLPAQYHVPERDFRIEAQC